MNRLTDHRYAEAIGAAFDLLPPALLARLRDTHFLTGCDPCFVGLHRYAKTFDGRSYADTAHAVYGWSQPIPADRRRTTIVLPILESHGFLGTILHELGHVLDEQLGFRHVARPINDYAGTSDAEAFACAFEAWHSVSWRGGHCDRPMVQATDPATAALFEALAA